mmetsp:Transcript_5518/g.4821  ORF Transcript_5518/g.4821 Transcript_5518/m.4821 type:complete len:168 (-) Transcript_5518:207-710(-)
MPAKPEKRLRRELERITKNQVEGCAAKLRGQNIFEWEAYIEGPKDSPFEGGIFHLYLNFPQNYPIKPPNVIFKTKIYHCNIADNGSICLDILKGNWSPVLTIQKVLLSIISLLCDPNADDPLVGHVARVYKSDRNQFNKTAKEWTKQHAMGKTNKNKMKKILETKKK